MGIWVAASASPDPFGHRVEVVAPGSLAAAVDRLLEVEGADRLKVGAGEHIAAIWMTALFGPPDELDHDGGPDLAYRRENRSGRWPFAPSADLLAVEVKSAPGKWREAHSRMELGDEHLVKVTTAAARLDASESVVDRAIRQLDRKLLAEPHHSERHVFLLLHPLDGLAIETYGSVPVVGHSLPGVDPSVKIDKLWVCWYPDLLAHWCRDSAAWTDVLQAAPERPDARASGAGNGLMGAEAMYLDRIRFAEPSPWQLNFARPHRDGA